MVEGRRIDMPPMSVASALIAGRLSFRLGRFASDHGLGRVAAHLLFRLQPDGNSRRPDGAFVSYGRWPRTRRVPSDDAWAVVPDLAAEVVSPSDPAGEIVGKVGEYFAAGVRLVWLVYPKARAVYVYMSPTRVEILGPADALDGSGILPGFRMAVADLFEGVFGEEGPSVPEGAA